MNCLEIPRRSKYPSLPLPFSRVLCASIASALVFIFYRDRPRPRPIALKPHAAFPEGTARVLCDSPGCFAARCGRPAARHFVSIRSSECEESVAPPLLREQSARCAPVYPCRPPFVLVYVDAIVFGCSKKDTERPAGFCVP